MVGRSDCNLLVGQVSDDQQKEQVFLSIYNLESVVARHSCDFLVVL